MKKKGYLKLRSFALIGLIVVLILWATGVIDNKNEGYKRPGEEKKSDIELANILNDEDMKMLANISGDEEMKMLDALADAETNNEKLNINNKKLESDNEKLESDNEKLRKKLKNDNENFKIKNEKIRKKMIKSKRDLKLCETTCYDSDTDDEEFNDDNDDSYYETESRVRNICNSG